jgi:hypothetical protein
MAVVMIDELSECAFEMPRVREQQPVQTLGPNGPYESLRDPMRLRDPNPRSNDTAARCFKYGVEGARECAVMIAN